MRVLVVAPASADAAAHADGDIFVATGVYAVRAFCVEAGMKLVIVRSEEIVDGMFKSTRESKSGSFLKVLWAAYA
jgi:hypothetical protein